MSRSDDSHSLKLCEFTTLISSVQIVNLLGSLESHDIISLNENLEFIYQNKNSAICQNSSEKPFQRLLFLIRDWVSVHVELK